MRLRIIMMALIGLSLCPTEGFTQATTTGPADSAFIQLKLVAPHDSAFYKTFPKNLTVRAFASRKYTRLLISEPAGILTYRPNNPPNIGIGATYRALTINLAAGLGFFAPTGEKGKTHYLDLQSHLYFRTFTVDFLGQFYRGYYIGNNSFEEQPDNYTRPDIKVNLIGLAGYYVFNFRRFSYRSSLIQDDWQQKSAGSLLAGWEMYYGAVGADSALAPTFLQPDTAGRNIYATHFFQMGPGVGYAYTFVYRKHYFITGAATVNASLGFTREYGNGIFDRFGITPNVTYRAAAGYNGNVWGVNASWVNSQISQVGGNSNEAYRLKTGTYRFTVSKHLGLSAKTRRKINAVGQKVQNVITP